ncbi:MULTISPECIES: cation:proton antiporter [Turicibacter]|jgi:transporter, CPA2 family|uniref:cation:proton antiporter n=4 Tax=Turicibacteraceae TaxID=2810281 RepID=UPI0003110871|nr:MULTISPECIES: cation:proton antiporter [Turicibacter]MBP3903231.1 cation:proton antiporter [Turicibacter sp.]MCU7191248.1 cation:proton antiporter [Turicibacter sanguinis]MCU7196126.1 cation:proton antiporter [Turicibacter sanguinis]MCU7200648.1 cation:proton antiporter [Turicibacter sanguinis]MCU7210518.1 cation:proton antiporter [Turicibacter sanguinis]
MLSYNYLFDIALILLSTKGLGLVTKKFSMPQVVGALLAGLVLGPAMLNVLHETDFIKQIAELGVIVLMFTAGLETDLQELKKTGKASFVIAVFGVLVPLLFGFITASFFNQTSTAEGVSHTLQNIFIGIILTATSVSITVETLKELGKLNTRAGNAILGAAIIDDILGIVALTLITSCADSSVNIVLVLGKVILFFVFAILAGMLFYKFFIYWVQRYNRDMRRFVVISFVFCLILAFLAEEWFGVADITGAFIAGLILSNTSCVHYITSRFETISYMLLSPIFFASIGIQVDLSGMNQTLLLFTVVLVVIAIISKIIGCGLGAKLCHYSTKESLQVGVGMVSRGEVALIVASKGAALGLMSAVNFGPIVVVVVITTIVTPILLKIVFSSKKDSRNLTKTNSKLIKS